MDDTTLFWIGFGNGSRLGRSRPAKLTAELLARGIKTDRRAVWTFLHGEGLSLKKTVVPAEQDRPDIARKCRRWKAHQGKVDPRRLVFIDETWIKTNMAPLRGWGPKGLRWRARCRMASGRP